MDTVQEVVKNSGVESTELWQIMFECTVMEENLDYFEEFYATYKTWASEEEKFRLKWMHAELYRDKGLEQEKNKLKEELLTTLDNLKYNTYLKEWYQSKIEKL